MANDLKLDKFERWAWRRMCWRAFYRGFLMRPAKPVGSMIAEFDKEVEKAKAKANGR